jgi:carbonic anhydrase
LIAVRSLPREIARRCIPRDAPAALLHGKAQTGVSMDRLVQGVAKFQREVFPQKQQLFEELAGGQNPEALFITCADSRIVPDLIMQTNPGDLFICRNAGNMVPPYGELHGGVSATIEYAVRALNVEHIIVCGHSDCGAMKGILHPELVADMPTVQTWLSHGEVARRMVTENYPNLPEAAKLDVITEENVVAQLEHLRTHPSVAARLARGTLSIHGWVYDFRTSHVSAWDAPKGRFVPIEEYSLVSSVPRSRLVTSAAD